MAFANKWSIALSETVIGPVLLFYSIFIEHKRQTQALEKTKTIQLELRELDTIRQLINQELSIRSPEGLDATNDRPKNALASPK